VGNEPELIFSEPTDLRPLTDDDLEFDHVESKFLEFTPQIFAPGDDDEAEFDDMAIHMSVILLYGPATVPEEGGQLSIVLNQVDHNVQEFVAQPFVSQLLHSNPTRYVSLVGYCG
jgi:hypothetical protein